MGLFSMIAGTCTGWCRLRCGGEVVDMVGSGMDGHVVEDEVDQLLKRMMLRRSRSVGVHTFLGTWAHNLRKARYWTNQG